MLLSDAFTLDANTLSKKTGLPPETACLRPVRLNLLRDALVKEFIRNEPTIVASESPFMGRFPKAFAALVECVFAERSALREYDSEKVLIMITPTTVKVSAGVPHNSSDKEEMRDAVHDLKDLDLGEIVIDDLDEHAIDAIHVARCAILQARGEVIPFVRAKKKRKSKKVVVDKSIVKLS